MTIPDGWTDDMNILLPSTTTVEEVVEFIIQAAMSKTPNETIESLIAHKYLLSTDDAALARDRTFGGIVRAATKNPENRPSRVKDPMAWESFQRATQDSSIIARIFPKYASKE